MLHCLSSPIELSTCSPTDLSSLCPQKSRQINPIVWQLINICQDGLALDSIIVLPHLPGTLAVFCYNNFRLAAWCWYWIRQSAAITRMRMRIRIRVGIRVRICNRSWEQQHLQVALQMHFCRESLPSREREREPSDAFGQVNNESKKKNQTRSGLFLNNGIAKMNDRTRRREDRHFADI